MTNNIDGPTSFATKIGGALGNMTPLSNKTEQSDREILRDVEITLATLTERIAHIQAGVDKLTNKIDGNIITREEYGYMKRWLTGTTVGLVVTFIIACSACVGVAWLMWYIFTNGL